MRPVAEDIRAALRDRFERATETGEMPQKVSSGVFHEEFGGHPGPIHRMPACCEVVRGEMTKADEVFSAPPNGNGASVAIRSLFPRYRRTVRRTRCKGPKPCTNRWYRQARAIC